MACESSHAALALQFASGKSALIIDAKCAFNNLERTKALRATQQIVPEVYLTYKNFYESESRAFHYGKEITISEGTIQGCGLSTGFYDIGGNPLVQVMKEPLVSQQWIYDDLAATGNPDDLRLWFEKLILEGPKFGYFPNAEKCYILAHDE